MISGSITQRGGVSGSMTSGVGGTTDYTELENKPSINNVELIGNKNAHDLDLASVQDVATLTGQLSDLASDVALMGQKLPKNYSTDEQATGQHWIDGRMIYQRTLTPNEVPAFTNTGQSREINLGLSNINNIWLHPLSSLNNNAFPLPYIHYDSPNIVGYWWDMNNGNPLLNIRAGYNSAFATIDYITVLYTKINE